MKCFEKIFVVSAIALLLPLSASGARYYGFADFGGSWYNADKSTSTDYDVTMCRAATTSTVLQYIGWGKVQGHDFNPTDDLFLNYPGDWTNKSGFIRHDWSWLFDDSKQSQGRPGWPEVDKTVGSYFSTESFNKYSVEDNNDRNPMKNIDTWHHDGYGVGLSIHKISMSGGHAPAPAPVQPVPEPATMLLMGLGMFGLAYSIRSRRQ